MSKKYFLTGISLWMLIPASYVLSQTPVGYDFLRTSVGARPSAMGGAFVGMVGDIHNLAYNPAGLSHLTEKRATASYLNHLMDFNSGFIAFAQPAGGGSAGLALNFIDYGQFQGRDANNQDIGEFGSNGLTLSLSYSRFMLKDFSLGASAKYIRFQIQDFTATAVAADLGATYTMRDKELSIGLALLNVGRTASAFIETKEDLPMSIQLGASKVLEHLPVIISGAFVKFKDESLDFRIGGEITFTEQLRFRLGYNSIGQEQKVDTDMDRFAGVSFGFGFKLNQIDVDYSLSSFGEVGSLNRFTLVGRF